MREILTISPSAFVTFYKCSQWHKWSYIDELEPDEGTDNLYAIFGTTFHKIMELHNRFDIKLEELKSSWRVLFLTYCTDAKNLSEQPKSTIKSFIDNGYEYIDNAFEMKERWNKYKIKDIEKYVRIEYPNKYLKNVYLSGRMDLILVNSDDEYVCLDWKTAKKKETNVDSNDQLTFYLYFLSKIYQVSLESVYGALVYPYTKDILFTQRQQEHIDLLLPKIDIMLDRISRNDIRKEPKVNFVMHDCHFCPFIKRCVRE